MRKKKSLDFGDMIFRAFPEKSKEGNLCHTITFQVTDACNLACKYCYQINKGKRSMSFDTAKKMIDLLLSGDKGVGEFVNPDNSPAIIIDFIGGEPFLEIELIEQIIAYFKKRTRELMHPWATMHRFSICSNGVEYFNPKVQEVLKKYKDDISFTVTIDGNKELHDSCRVFPDGTGSYDKAVAAAMDYIKKGGSMGSKITIAPENLPYVKDAIMHMIELGYDEIFANTVFEKGWEQHHATEFYYILKDLANHFIDDGLADEVYCSLFEENMFCPKDEKETHSWCGGASSMLAVDPDGYIYPCLRFMESSLGTEQEAVRIGHVDTGIGYTEKEKCWMCDLKCVNRRTQCDDECYYCPIGTGCADCAAYNYQDSGTLFSKSKYHCEMHKARALANSYFWNMYYKSKGIKKSFHIHCPKEWALNIIDEDEYNMLLELEKETKKYED